MLEPIKNDYFPEDEELATFFKRLSSFEYLFKDCYAEDEENTSLIQR